MSKVEPVEGGNKWYEVFGTVASKILDGQRSPMGVLFFMIAAYLVGPLALLAGIWLSSGLLAEILGLALAVVVVGPVVAILFVVITRPENLYGPADYTPEVPAKEFIELHQSGRNRRTEVIAVSEKVEVATVEAESEESTTILSEGESKEETEWERVFIIEATSEDMDFDRFETAYQKVIATEENPARSLEIELHYLLARYRHGDAQAFDALQQVVIREQESPERVTMARIVVANAWQSGGNFKATEKTLRDARESAVTSSQHLEITLLLANALHRQDRGAEAIQELLNAIEAAKVDKERAELFAHLSETYSELGLPELASIAMDKAVELLPSATAIRFSAARKFDAANDSIMTYFHYKRLLAIDPRNSSAINNIGVQYAELELPIKSRAAYRKAIELKEPLGVSNLAGRMLSAGLDVEALALLDQAENEGVKSADTSRVRARISEVIEAEDTREESILAIARTRQHFLAHCADAIFVANSRSHSFEGEWRTDLGIAVTIEVAGTSLKAKWEQPNPNQSFELAATVLGNVATVDYLYRTNQGSIIGENIGNAGVMYVFESGFALNVMATKGEESTYLTMRRDSPGPSNTLVQTTAQRD